MLREFGVVCIYGFLATLDVKYVGAHNTTGAN